MVFCNRALRGVLLSALFGAAGAAHALTPVFINEIHYDDATAAGDVGEAVEVAGPAGTNLTGWTVVLYNGSGGAPYATLNLSGLIPSQCSGHGAVSVLAPGLQNGAPDGLALVNGTTVVQFLSYEGTFVAVGGPANGLLSTDIGVAESNSTLAGTSLQLTGSGSNYEDFAWQGSAADSFGNCNTGQSFGPPVDVAPSVASTVPADGATGIASNASIAVNFSEPVTLGGAWFSLSCGVSGVHTGVTSGSGAAYTVAPSVAFDSGEFCSMTVFADQVTDLDGTADEMAEDYTFGFSTAGDLPPSVSATVPANNASGFPRGANLSVTFSEAVTLDAGWYSLVCASSGVHTAVESTSGNTRTLNPDTDLAVLEHCDLTVLANHVHDQDGTIQDMLANVQVGFETAADVSNYYNGVDTSSGPALKAWLHNRIKDHVAIPYGQTYTVMNVADQDPTDPSKILDVYKNESYPKQISGAANYNREHTWPKSLGFPNETDGGKVVPPHTDGHMLYASHVGYNSDRGNSPYVNCSGCTERPTTLNHGFGGGTGSYPGNSNWFNSSGFETWNHRKGDVARAVMYMVVRYKGGVNADGVMEPNLELTDNLAQIVGVNAQATGGLAYMGLKSVLLDWNDLDPPDAQEQLRNEAVYSFQTNRNPFIDHPEWARCVINNTNCPVVVDLIFANGFE